MNETKTKFQYSGKLEEYQIQAKEKQYQAVVERKVKYQLKSYTKYQNLLYKRALYGMGGYKKEELENLSEERKQLINRIYYKGQVAINLYKQKVTNRLSNLVFEEYFPESPITAFFKECNEVDEEHKNTLTFKELNINKDQIITIFIEEGVLPKNFHSLKKDPNQLPRLKNASKEKNL